MSATNSMQYFPKLDNYLRAYALKLTNDIHKSEDLYQDTALLAYRHRDKFKGGTNLKAWTRTIMKNVFINKFRTKKRRIEVQDNNGELFLFDSNLNHSNANEGESSILMTEINKIIDALKPEYSVPFRLAQKGFKYSDISQMLNIPLGTLKSRIFMAKKELQSKIKAIYGVESYKELL